MESTGVGQSVNLGATSPLHLDKQDGQIGKSNRHSSIRVVSGETTLGLVNTNMSHKSSKPSLRDRVVNHVNNQWGAVTKDANKFTLVDSKASSNENSLSSKIDIHNQKIDKLDKLKEENNELRGEIDDFRNKYDMLFRCKEYRFIANEKLKRGGQFDYPGENGDVKTFVFKSENLDINLAILNKKLGKFRKSDAYQAYKIDVNQLKQNSNDRHAIKKELRENGRSFEKAANNVISKKYAEVKQTIQKLGIGHRKEVHDKYAEKFNNVADKGFHIDEMSTSSQIKDLKNQRGKLKKDIMLNRFFNVIGIKDEVKQNIELKENEIEIEKINQEINQLKETEESYLTGKLKIMSEFNDLKGELDGISKALTGVKRDEKKR